MFCYKSGTDGWRSKLLDGQIGPVNGFVLRNSMFGQHMHQLVELVSRESRKGICEGTANKSRLAEDPLVDGVHIRMNHKSRVQQVKEMHKSQSAASAGVNLWDGISRLWWVKVQFQKL